MTPTKVRAYLFIVWLGSFSLNCLAALSLYFRGWIESDSFQQLLQQISAVYVGHLGVIVSFYLGAKGIRGAVSGSTIPRWLALVSSLLWTGLVSSFVIRLGLGFGVVEEAIEQMGFVVPILSWIVSPTLGYYFGTQGKTA